ncbi:hypothetical protein [Hyphomicrobium sp. 99]|uniref:hypothetical protein n=1 Tax=Hyphomicrobium sp. 99 TaxID=1163419 RepID=UPI0005F786B9|nr:hypothetical protein [Hyphomicrobium sp. 99]
MKSAKAWIATCFLLAAGGAPAMAADWGGVKDMGGGVAIPVPAPVPVPTYDADSDWYVGLALGGNIFQDAKITDYEQSGPTTNVDSGSIGNTPIFGLNFGRYITPSLRAEIAVDYTPGSEIYSSSISDYTTATRSAAGPTYINPTTQLPSPTFDTNFYDVSRSDKVKLSRTTALFNLLYDIPTGTRFTPYVGGGFGFSWRQIKRNYKEVATCNQSTNTSAGLDGGINYPDGYCVNTATLPATYTTTGKTTKDQIDFAAAVQAGIATNITDTIIWDNGWQMLWEGGAISSTVPTVSGENRVVYKDAVLQQFRSGLRIKFD